MNPKFVSPVLMWTMVVLGALAIYELAPSAQLIAKNPVTPALLVLALLNWFYFFFGALWANRSAASSAAGVKKLVTWGVYARVRHPIYSADIILAWAAALFLGDQAFLIIALWLTLVIYYWMGLEESALLEKFGNGYVEYKHTVPKLFPRIKTK